jgi:type II secretory pathway component PulF
MPEFSYVARNAQGKLSEGVLFCPDRSAAIRQVEREFGIPIKIQPVADRGSAPQKSTQEPSPQPVPPSVKTSSPGRPKKPSAQRKDWRTSLSGLAGGVAGGGDSVKKLSTNQLYLFTEQLAHLLAAGMTLDEALGIMVRRLKDPKLGALSKTLHQALVEGRSLSQAMREFPATFSPLYVNMVSAGEASGALDDILTRLVKHLSEIKALRDRVQQALVYPSLLVVVGMLLILAFIKVMVPQLMGFFQKSGQALPAPAQILLQTNQLLTHYWWAAIAAGFAGMSLFKIFTRSPEGRLAWDTFVWNLPVVSSIPRHRYYAQFARTLGTLMQNGVTLLRALELLEDISGNECVRQKMALVRKAVVDGAAVSVAVTEQGVFPELFADMTAVGEQSGRFAETMQMVGNIYERELDKQVQITSSLIPPLVMLLIASVVGMVVYAILSAVFSLTGSLHA